MQLGLVHIYTGDGKGKTTSAVGLATRALGRGLKVCYVSFHKRPELYGYSEMNILKGSGAVVLNRAKGHPKLDKSIDPVVNSQQVKDAIIEIEELISREHFDILIMDEVMISVRDNYLDESELIRFIKARPADLELVLTGRGATEGLIEVADYVSNITKVKHPFDKGVMSRKGVEF
ncbi:MAG: cob(I)yrinic acid a,c-diamide adenosyltransferase [Rikenellaceae bacterium]